jgi:mannose-6-phosphate isomerase
MTISRPMINVWIRCIWRELVELTDSSKLIMVRNTKMKLTDDQNISPVIEDRPWGRFIILDECDTFKVKRIEVWPEKRLSYQRHSRRAEHWFVVRGTAKVTLNDVEILVKTGEAIDIAVRDAHRVENPHSSETLVFIETQTGSYFGEDDIERLDDDFGRKSNS